MEILWIILGVIALIIVWLIFTYNGLITYRNQADEAWSDIDVQLKRRYNLIPNLVQTVKAYAKHESSVFEKVTQARSAAMGAKTMEEHAKTENMLSDTLKSLFAVAEAYPDLKASTNFMQLQDELTDAENKIQAARRFYNNNTRIFNTKLQKFPTNMIGGILGFKAKEFFEAVGEEKEVPKVQF